MKELFVLSEAMAQIYAASASANLFDFSFRFFHALQSVLQYERAIIHIAGKTIPSHTDLMQISFAANDIDFWSAQREQSPHDDQFQSRVLLSLADHAVKNSPASPEVPWPMDAFSFAACPGAVRRLVCFNPLGMSSQGLVPDWLLLYRDAANAFVYAETQAVCALWPHFLSAYSRLLAAQLDTADRYLAGRASALASRSGVVLVEDACFRLAVAEEWPLAIHPYLPAQAIPGETLPFLYEGKYIRMTVTAGESGDLLAYRVERK